MRSAALWPHAEVVILSGLARRTARQIEKVSPFYSIGEMSIETNPVSHDGAGTEDQMREACPGLLSLVQLRPPVCVKYTESFAAHTDVLADRRISPGGCDGDHISEQLGSPRLQSPTCLPVLSSTPHPPLSHLSPTRLRAENSAPSDDRTVLVASSLFCRTVTRIEKPVPFGSYGQMGWPWASEAMQPPY